MPLKVKHSKFKQMFQISHNLLMSLLIPNSTKIMVNAVSIKNLTKKPNCCSVVG